MCNIKCGQLLFEDFPVACCDILGKDYDRYVSIGKGLRYFDAVISPMVFLAKDTEQCTRPTCATLMSYFGSCFVALSVLLQVWIGPVHGIKFSMIGTVVESMNWRPFMASGYDQNHVSSNLWGQGGLGGQNTDGTANCRCIVATKD